VLRLLVVAMVLQVQLPLMLLSIIHVPALLMCLLVVVVDVVTMYDVDIADVGSRAYTTIRFCVPHRVSASPHTMAFGYDIPYVCHCVFYLCQLDYTHWTMLRRGQVTVISFVLLS